MTKSLFTASLLLLVGLAGGCQKNSAAPAPGADEPKTRPATRSAAQLPKLPGEDSKEPQDGAMPLMITATAASRPKGEAGYTQDDKVDSGNLVGAIKFVGAMLDRAKVPSIQPFDFDKHPIPDADKGELDYYKNLRIKERRYTSHDYYNVPTYGVVIVRGLKKGRRPEQNRAVFMVNQGEFGPHIEFGPVGERVMFGTYESYPTDVVMTKMDTGKAVMQEQVSAFDRDTIKPLGGGGVHYTRQPRMGRSPVMQEMGGYAITSKRHLWKAAYVFVIDSPYALVAHGRFSLDSVPAGNWKVDVWHPEFEAVQKTYDVTIEKDETTELAVEFRVPPWLAATQPAEKK